MHSAVVNASPGSDVTAAQVLTPPKALTITEAPTPLSHLNSETAIRNLEVQRLKTAVQQRLYTTLCQKDPTAAVAMLVLLQDHHGASFRKPLLKFDPKNIGRIDKIDVVKLTILNAFPAVNLQNGHLKIFNGVELNAATRKAQVLENVIDACAALQTLGVGKCRLTKPNIVQLGAVLFLSSAKDGLVTQAFKDAIYYLNSVYANATTIARARLPWHGNPSLLLQLVNQKTGSDTRIARVLESMISQPQEMYSSKALIKEAYGKLPTKRAKFVIASSSLAATMSLLETVGFIKHQPRHSANSVQQARAHATKDGRPLDVYTLASHQPQKPAWLINHHLQILTTLYKQDKWISYSDIRLFEPKLDVDLRRKTLLRKDTLSQALNELIELGLVVSKHLNWRKDPRQKLHMLTKAGKEAVKGWVETAAGRELPITYEALRRTLVYSEKVKSCKRD